MNKKVFLRELKKFVRMGMVEEETYSRIENFYLDEEGGEKSLLSFFIILASLLIGLGLILIFAYNWQKLSRYQKSTIVISLLIFSQMLAFFVRFYKKNEKIYEASALFQVLMVALSIALISQIYNISGELDNFLLTWALLIIPIIYVMKSKISYVMYQIIALSYYFDKLETSKLILIPYLIMVAAGYICMHLKKDESKVLKALTFIFIYLAFSGFYLELDMGWKLNLVYFVTTFNAIYLKIEPLKGLAKAGILGLTYLLTFKNFIIQYQKIDLNFDFYLGFIILSLLFVLPIYLLYRYRETAGYKDVLCISQLLILSIFLTDLAYIAYNIYFAMLALYYLMNAVKTIDVGRMNFSMFMIFLLVISRFFDQDIPILPRAIIFILMGIIILILNVYFAKKRDKYEK